MIIVYPKRNCKGCFGNGFVSGDWVDYGSTKAQLPDEYCDCVLDQLPEDYDGKFEVVQYREEVRNMKLTLTVVAAFSGLVYAIMRAYAPDLPFSQDQVLTVLLLALAALGVTVTEEQVRAWFVRRGFNGFR